MQGIIQLAFLLVGDDGAQAQILDIDHAAIRERQRPLQDVLQLAHVAGERIALQVAQCHAGELRNALQTAALCQPLQNGVSQNAHVLLPLAQRRHAQLDHVEPIEKVLPEPSLCHALRQVLMGGADDAHIHRFFRHRPHLADALFLDGAQQLHLHGQRQIGHLIQEQRAAIGRHEEADPIGVCPRERPLAVAEELRLHQILGNGAAVHGDERPFGTAAQLVDQPRSQLLAGTGLTGDVHGRHAACHARDGSAHRVDGGRRAQKLGGLAPGLRRWWRDRVLRGRGIGELQGRTHQRPQRIQPHRLVQIIEGPCLQRRHGIFRAGVGSDDGHRRVAPLAVDEPNQIQAIAVRQAHVGQAQRIAVALQHRTRRGQVLGHVHVQPHAHQRQLQQLAQAFLVVHHQHPGRPSGGQAVIVVGGDFHSSLSILEGAATGPASATCRCWGVITKPAP